MTLARSCGACGVAAVLDLTGGPLVMGVLNVTPDSFSDGGDYLDASTAVARGAQMIEEGADLIDIGGESTRPGSESVCPAEQIRRTQPVIARIHQQYPAVPISIDTRLSEVASAAIDAGASIVNDVSALRDDPAMTSLVAGRHVPVVLMHMQGDPKTMQQAPHYGDVVADVVAFLSERMAAAVAAGIDRSMLIVDPGIGFGKTVRHNLDLIRRLSELVRLEAPILIGVSRKRFIGSILQIDDPRQRGLGTAAAVAACVLGGANIVRVHDVEQTIQVVRMCDAILHPERFG